jgi:hypothetical protein
VRSAQPDDEPAGTGRLGPPVEVEDGIGTELVRGDDGGAHLSAAGGLQDGQDLVQPLEPSAAEPDRGVPVPLLPCCSLPRSMSCHDLEGEPKGGQPAAGNGSAVAEW